MSRQKVTIHESLDKIRKQIDKKIKQSKYLDKW